MFKNVIAYKITDGWNVKNLAEALSKHAFRKCESLDLSTKGWGEPVKDGGLAHTVAGNTLLSFAVEKKLLPSSYVTRVAKEKAARIEEDTGRKVGRKEFRDLKDAVYSELLPKAFTSLSSIYLWIDSGRNWLFVATTSSTKADEALLALAEAVEDLPNVARPDVNISSNMADWLAKGAGPSDFTIDDQCDLADSVSKAAVKFIKYPLSDADVVAKVKEHLAEGKTPVRVAMTYDNRISFSVTSSLELKGLSLVGVTKSEAGGKDDPMEKFDAEFLLEAEEIGGLMDALTAAITD